MWWYRHLVALGGSLNIIFMVAANLVGFSVGLDGLSTVLNKIFDLKSIIILLELK